MSKKLFFNAVKNAPSCIVNASEDSDFLVFCNASEDESEPVELLIMEQIGEDWYGDGVIAKDVVGFLKEHKDREVHVRVNSPGGLVYDGFVIYNALVSHKPEVVVTIEGLAFSAASYIAMAGDKVQMHKASDLGIHRSSTVAWGNAKDLAASIEWLDTIDGHLVEIYEDRTGASTKQINKWLDGVSDGTLFSATDALKNGFIDEIIDPKVESKSNKKSKNAAEQAGRAAAKRTAARNRLRLGQLSNNG